MCSLNWFSAWHQLATCGATWAVWAGSSACVKKPVKGVLQLQKAPSEAAESVCPRTRRKDRIRVQLTVKGAVAKAMVLTDLEEEAQQGGGVAGIALRAQETGSVEKIIHVLGGWNALQHSNSLCQIAYSPPAGILTLRKKGHLVNQQEPLLGLVLSSQSGCKDHTELMFSTSQRPDWGTGTLLTDCSPARLL